MGNNDLNQGETFHKKKNLNIENMDVRCGLSHILECVSHHGDKLKLNLAYIDMLCTHFMIKQRKLLTLVSFNMNIQEPYVTNIIDVGVCAMIHAWFFFLVYKLLTGNVSPIVPHSYFAVCCFAFLATKKKN